MPRKHQDPQVFLLTGGLACGKSTVANLLERQGAAIIDTDQIAKSLLLDNGPCFQAVVHHFGQKILLTPQEKNKNSEKISEKNLDSEFQSSALEIPQINRKKLREIIFSDPLEKHWLEKLLHPKIREIALEKANQLKKSPSPPSKIFIVIPLLASRDLYPADKILTIECPYDLQIKRVMERDQISEELAIQMIQSQPSTEQRQKIADFIIFNDDELTLDDLNIALNNALSKP
jgi:dephospho-CoA kinase